MGETSFNCYIYPKKPIARAASDVTQISIGGGVLYHKGQPVKATSIREALTQFLKFLQQFKNPVLIGHNIKNFDCQVLVNTLMSLGLLSRFKNIICIDTMLLFKDILPGLQSYKQEMIVSDVLGESYNAHNALDDVKVLQRMYNQSHIPQTTVYQHSFSMMHVHDRVIYRKMKNANCISLQVLLEKNIISKTMVDKNAGSGLSYDDLKLACDRGGVDALEVVLTERQTNGKPRVTKSRKILNTIGGYFSEQKIVDTG
ncbi:uncharacterized protein LOC144445401 [Glandiceps talaboti]